MCAENQPSHPQGRRAPEPLMEQREGKAAGQTLRKEGQQEQKELPVWWEDTWQISLSVNVKGKRPPALWSPCAKNIYIVKWFQKIKGRMIVYGSEHWTKFRFPCPWIKFDWNTATSAPLYTSLAAPELHQHSWRGPAASESLMAAIWNFIGTSAWFTVLCFLAFSHSFIHQIFLSTILSGQ